jgi:hypothetical protein
MQWFEDVMFYGFKDNSFDPDDEDTNFIPRLAEKVLVPKLTGHYLLFCCMGSGNNQSYSVQSTLSLPTSSAIACVVPCFICTYCRISIWTKTHFRQIILVFLC